jgi:hypothetical protein
MSFFEPPHYVNYYQSKHGIETIILLKTEHLLSKESKKLLCIFSMHVALRLENLLID